MVMGRILLAGGRVVDGSGAEPFAADVLLEGERIAAVILSQQLIGRKVWTK